MGFNKIVWICCRDHIYGVRRPIYRARFHVSSSSTRTSLNELSGGRHKCGPYNIIFFVYQKALLRP